MSLFEVQVLDVNTSSVDNLEITLKSKVETISNYNDNPAAAVQTVFKQMDANGSGKISLEEFTKALNKINFTGVDKEIAALFRRYDVDNSGYLTLKEFGNALFKTGDKKVRATSTIGKVREILAARAGGFQSLRDIGRQFMVLDKDKSGTITREELQKGLELMLRGYNVTLSRAENERVFQAFDLDGSGTITYSEFIRGIRGGMNSARRDIVKQAFQMLDSNSDGTLTPSEIAKKFNVSQHPRVLSGEWTEQKVVDTFLQSWDIHHHGEVSEDDFMEYFEWISSNITDDAYFELMIRNSFHISGGEGWAENTTNRRVLATLKDGTQKVLEIKNDLGIGSTDIPAMMENLKSQGYDVQSIQLTGGN